MRLIWVRHTETEANQAGRYLGHADVPLSDHGRNQAGQTASLLAKEQITRLYASDLSRTMETARVIGEVHGLSPIPVTSLRELDFGAWDLHTYNEVMQKEPERLTEWYDNPFEIAVPSGESLRQLGERFDSWLSAQVEAHESDATIVCVTHGGPLRWFLCKWIHGDETQFWSMPGTPCGGFFAAEWDGRMWRLQ